MVLNFRYDRDNSPMALAARPFTVLVVDDEALLRWSIAELLRRQGHEVLEASTARQARDCLTETADGVDLVLLDLRLPDSTDLGLLGEVRRRLPDSVVLLMTAYAQGDVIEQALREGAARVLTKPFDMGDLEKLVADVYLARLGR
jgi:DNA-binding NtrC family response regulator